MEMIGHDAPGVQFDIRVLLHQPHTGVHHDVPEWVGDHLPIHDLPKQAFPPLHHQGDEIDPRLGVIVSFQAQGRPAGMEKVFARQICSYELKPTLLI